MRSKRQQNTAFPTPNTADGLMEQTTERLAWIRLALMPYIGAETFYELYRHYGSAAAVWEAEREVAGVLPSKPAQEAWRTRRHEAQAAADAALAWEK